MMRVALAVEPPSFDGQVRQPGLRAVAELVGELALRAPFVARELRRQGRLREEDAGG
jgi:hypothetical protein